MDVDTPAAASPQLRDYIFLRGALDSAAAVVYTIDRSFRIMTVNAAWDAFARANDAPQLLAPHVIGTNLLDWIHGAHREQSARICEAIFDGTLPRYEWDFDASSPRERRVCAIVVTPLHGPDGAIAGATFMSYDVTQRKLLEEAVQARNVELRTLVGELQRQRAELERERDRAQALAQVAAAQAAQLEATIGAISDGVWMCDATGRLVTINDAALRMLGLRREAVEGQSIDLLTSIICEGELRRLGLRRALQGSIVHTECEIQLHGAASRLIVDISATSVRDVTGEITGAVAVVRDVTQAKALARMKDDFLAVAAHELKTPITALKGYAQLALKRLGDRPEIAPARRFLLTIDDQADRIASLVQKLLDVSRIHGGKLELHWSRFDLRELVAVIAERVRLLAPRHQIDVTAPVALLVEADMQRIEQVLFNLLDNAIKYSPGGEAIAVELVEDDTNAIVTVTDRGLGIPADKLPYIFDRWYQAHWDTHGDYGGMGLGLYISKEIVEQHGGRIWAVSDEHGSRIGFTIPRRPEQL